MDPIETGRLTLRNFTTDDWSDLRRMILQYMASPYAQYDHPWPTSEEELKGVAEWFVSGDAYMAVCLRPEGTFIGFVCLNARDDSPGMALNLGYVFNWDYHGRGYATEACQAALRRAFTDLGAERILTGTAEENEPSCRLLARLGLKPTVEPEGMYTLSREEWQAAR
jgi:RimJ/RimL family protein N-acetyltransferase